MRTARKGAKNALSRRCVTAAKAAGNATRNCAKITTRRIVKIVRYAEKLCKEKGKNRAYSRGQGYGKNNVS